MVSLKKLQDAIAKASEGKIEDWENAYMAENAMSSTSQAEINAYKTTFKDLVDAVNKLAGESSYEDVVKYVMANTDWSETRRWLQGLQCLYQGTSGRHKDDRLFPQP